MKTILASLIYIVAIVAANFSVFIFGPIVTPVNAFLLIGLDLAIRDFLHTKLGFAGAALISVCAGVVSWLLNPAGYLIAGASVAAFVTAALIDGIVYQWLIKKKWMIRSNGSNLAGAAADSVIFPLIAFGTFIPWVVLAQFIAKVTGGFIWSLVLKRK